MEIVPNAKLFYALGQRDTIACLFAMIRGKDIDTTLEELANKYKEVYDEPNPHVDWWLEQKDDGRS